jgi:hypothetical protein
MDEQCIAILILSVYLPKFDTGNYRTPAGSYVCEATEMNEELIDIAIR